MTVMVCVVITMWLYAPFFPREWMDVLSPPIMPARQPGRSGNTPNDWGNLGGGTVTLLQSFRLQTPFVSFEM